MARCLVIGANGFIGSHLVDALVAAGHTVVAFDRFSSGTASYLSSTVTQFVGEFLSRSDIEAAVAGQDYVFHFLSTTTPATAESDPTLDVRTNVASTIELLEACVSAGIKKFYFASSGGAIYGSQRKAEYSETDRALPISPYGIGKLTIEQYLGYFRTKHGLNSVSLRVSNPYGTRQHPNKKQGLIPIVLRQIALGQPVVRFGDGSMVRDYVYVTDLVDMIVPLVDAETDFDLYNVGSGIGHSVTDILDSIREVTGVDFAIEERPVPSTFIDHVVLNTGRLQREFPFTAFTPLHEGVRLTYDEIIGTVND